MDSSDRLWLPKALTSAREEKLNKRLLEATLDYIRTFTRNKKILAVLPGMNKWSVDLELEQCTVRVYEKSDDFSTVYEEPIATSTRFDINLQLIRGSTFERTDILKMGSNSASIELEPNAAAEIVNGLERKYRKWVSNLLLSAYRIGNEYFDELEKGEPDADTCDFDRLMELEKAEREIELLQQMRIEIIEGRFRRSPIQPFGRDENLVEVEFPDELAERGLKMKGRQKKD